jgi:hypothetical protein
MVALNSNTSTALALRNSKNDSNGRRSEMDEVSQRPQRVFNSVKFVNANNKLFDALTRFWRPGRWRRARPRSLAICSLTSFILAGH